MVVFVFLLAVNPAYSMKNQYSPIDIDMQRLLLDAVKDDDYNAVRLAFRKGAKLNYQDNYNESVVKAAIDIRSPHMLRKLIKLGADVNQKFSLNQYTNSYNATPLTYAVEKGYSDMLLVLIDNGANIDDTDSLGRTPVYVAAEKGKRRILFRLKNAGANYFLKEPKHGLSPMHVAIKNGHSHIFDLLYEIDQRLVYYKDNTGRLPIHYAASTNSDILKNLLDKNNETVDAKDNKGRVALHYASSKGNLGAMVTLLEAGAEVNAVDKWNMNALHFAVITDNVRAVNILLAADIDTANQDKVKGDTPYTLATRKKMSDIITAFQEIQTN